MTVSPRRTRTCPRRRCRDLGTTFSAASRAAEIGDEEGAALRNADIGTALARRSAIPEENRQIGDAQYNELLIFDNTGFTDAEPGRFPTSVDHPARVVMERVLTPAGQTTAKVLT